MPLVTTAVGLRYIPTNGEATAPGCLCEGWGVANADGATGTFAGYANIATDGGAVGLVVQPGTGVTATDRPRETGVRGKRVQIGRHHQQWAAADHPQLPSLAVTQPLPGRRHDREHRHDADRRASIPAGDGLGHRAVHVQRVGRDPRRNRGQRAARDDGRLPVGEPAVESRSRLRRRLPSHDAGPRVPRLLRRARAIRGRCSTSGSGLCRRDRRRSFRIYYGAAANRDARPAAIATVGAEVYSLGLPSQGPRPVGEPRADRDTSDAATDGPHAFIFAFSGVGGTRVTNSAPVADSKTVTHAARIRRFPSRSAGATPRRRRRTSAGRWGRPATAP